MDNLILVVDDSPETLGFLNDALEEVGMTTLVALDGNQAIKIATKMKPDIILLDAMMPNMDGFQTCVELKKNGELASVPVIFMTGLSDTESVVKGFEAGGVDYLTKPINPIELIARMKVHLANARLTSKAQSALDSTGQNVFTANQLGDILWATPQVQSAVAKMDDAAKNEFVEELKSWLSHKPNKGNMIQVSVQSHALCVVYVGQTDTQEYLLRLLDDKQLNDSDVLKEAFEITKRESEVLGWIAKGKTNREIALILEMSPRTVNKHLEQIFKKIEVDNRTSAARKAIETLQKKRGF